jgi:hypothetical protein
MMPLHYENTLLFVRTICSAKKQVDDVMDIMRDNLGKVLDRDDKLASLEDKSETLMVGAR